MREREGGSDSVLAEVTGNSARARVMARSQFLVQLKCRKTWESRITLVTYALSSVTRALQPKKIGIQL